MGTSSAAIRPNLSALFFGVLAILSPRRCAVIACWLLVVRLCFCLGRILSCTVVADVACLGASLCVVLVFC